MKNDLEATLVILKDKLAVVNKKIESQPDKKYLENIRRTYTQAIDSAERTLEAVVGLDPVILDTVIKMKKFQKS
ncbi:MAG TPA: hypothetical protein VK213_13215 [Bacteroidales bacterium]|nr:hypothetical protein [Bacteroidales bacterium]